MTQYQAPKKGVMAMYIYQSIYTSFSTPNKNNNKSLVIFLYNAATYFFVTVFSHNQVYEELYFIKETRV